MITHIVPHSPYRSCAQGLPNCHQAHQSDGFRTQCAAPMHRLHRERGDSTSAQNEAHASRTLQAPHLLPIELHNAAAVPRATALRRCEETSFEKVDTR